MKLIKIIWAKLTNGKLVYLRDHDGEITFTIAYRDPWGHLSAERHWPYRIKTVRLLDNGKVEDGTYVKEWISA